MNAITDAIVKSPFARKLGVQGVSAGHGEAVCRLPFDAHNTTIVDLVHGGAILALADCTATAAAWSNITEPDRYRGTTVALNLAFIGGARGADIEAQARIERQGNSLTYVSVRIVDTDATLIATADVVYKLDRLRTPTETMSALFANKTRAEQQQLLAGLERTGAQLYRTWAADAEGRAREALLTAAEREELNARTLDDFT